MSISAKLEDVFRALSPSDLAGAIDFRTGKQSELISALLIEAFLLTPVGGVLNTPDLKSRVDSVSAKATSQQRSELADILKMYTTVGYPTHATRAHKLARAADGSQIEVEMSKIVPDSVGRNVCIALIDAPYVHPTVRYADRAEMFLTAIPTHIMSRCVPKLDIEFRFDRPRYDKGAQAPGLLKFLLGASSEASSGANKAMFNSQRTVSGDRETITAGMEIFTSPQTLVPLEPSDANARYVSVVDPTRPMATLIGAEISVTPTVGMFSYKRAKLSFVLHDRSRMTELSDFLKPEVYPKTSVIMTYGWVHPDEPGNPYAEFINSQSSVRESYGIVNASYSFNGDGSVKIDLELFTRGVSEIKTTKVSESSTSSVALYRKLNKLRDDIAAYRIAKGLDTESGSLTEIRPLQILDGAERGSLANLSTQELKDAINKLLKTVEQPDPKIDPASQRQLASELKQLPDDLIAFRKSISAEIAERFSQARDGADPFLPDQDKYPDHPVANFVSVRNAAPQVSTKRSEKKIVSFAKVFSTFIISSMLSADPSVDLQVFFYTFNPQAGPVASTNIGEFPVEMQVFIDQWKEHSEKRGTENITIEEFTSVLAESTVSDPRSVGYGLRSFYTYDSKAGFVEDPTQTAKRESRTAELLGRYGVFKKPVIEIYIESAPATNGSKITRIHVFDKQCHPYRAAGSFLRASDGSSTFYEVSRAKLKRAAETADTNNITLIKQLAQQVMSDATSVRQIDASTNASLKSAIAATVPTIVYGTNCTSISSANLSSQHEALLSTVQMLRAGKKNNTQPNGAGTGGLPLRIIPSTLQMSMIGCPLIQLAQIWFIDFMTGTTIDNLYIVTQLTHSIQPGRFETQATFGFADAYGALEGAPSVISAIQSMASLKQDVSRQEKTVMKKRKDARGFTF